MDETEDYDDYKKKRRRRKRNTLDFENRLEKKCYNLLFEKSNKQKYNHWPEDCHACSLEQQLR